MSLDLHSLYLVSSPGWVLFRHGPFLPQFSPCFPLLLVCGSASILATPLHCFCHAITWFVLVGSPLGYHVRFLYLVHVAQYFCWVNSHTILGFLNPFYSFGHPRPTSFFWASLVHSILKFPWAFTKIFGLPRPNYHILYFWGLLAFAPTPFTNSFLWAPPTYFCLLSISYNSHGLTTSFSRLPWACLFSLGTFYCFIGLWTIIPVIWA